MKIYIANGLCQSIKLTSLSSFSLEKNIADADIIVSDDSRLEDLGPNPTPVIIYKKKGSKDGIYASDNSTLVEYEGAPDLEGQLKTELITKIRDTDFFREKYRKNFIPFFQEMVCIDGSSGNRAFEVLVRYVGDDGGIVGAKHILSFLTAEAALHIFKMLIEKIDFSTSQDIYSFNIPVSVINDDACCSELKREIDLRASKQNIIVELTENFIEQDINNENLKSLSESVDLILIDDFGSNRANLDFYNSMGIENLGVKIDMDLFKEISSGEIERFLIQARGLISILEKSKVFVFEGVETEHQLECLDALVNCPESQSVSLWCQGYALSIPSPVKGGRDE